MEFLGPAKAPTVLAARAYGSGPTPCGATQKRINFCHAPDGAFIPTESLGTEPVGVKAPAEVSDPDPGKTSTSAEE